MNPQDHGVFAGPEKPRAQPAPSSRWCWADGTGAVEPRSGGLRHLTLTRRSPRRRPGLQPQVRKDPLDHRCFEDGGDDLELPTAVRAVLQVDLESEASAQTNLYPSYVAAKTRLSSRAQLMRAGRRCSQAGSAAASSDAATSSSGHAGTTSARSFAFGASTPWKRMRCSRGRGTSAV